MSRAPCKMCTCVSNCDMHYIISLELPKRWTCEVVGAMQQCSWRSW